MPDLAELQDILDEPEFDYSVATIQKLQTTYFEATVPVGEKVQTYRFDYIEKRRFRIESDWFDQIFLWEKHPINLPARESNYAVYVGKNSLDTAMVRSAALKAMSDTFEDWYPPSEFLNSYVLKTSASELNNFLLYTGPETFIKIFKREFGGQEVQLSLLPANNEYKTPGKVLVFGTSYVWATDFKITKIS